MKVAVDIDRAQVAKYYRMMLLIRRFEEACARLYMQRLIRGFLHLYIGEEAVAVGAVGSLEPQDYVITHYRDHGHALARGMDPKVCMAELCGRATGSSGGKGGSMHLFDNKLHFMGRPCDRRRTNAHRGRNRSWHQDEAAERGRHDLLR